MLSIAEQHRRPCRGDGVGGSSQSQSGAPNRGSPLNVTRPIAASRAPNIRALTPPSEGNRTIVLELGPSVLGPTQWRELDHRYAGRILEELLAGLMADGAIESGPADPLSRLCCATAGEAALHIAGSDDPVETRRQAMQMLTTMFNGLLTD